MQRLQDDYLAAYRSLKLTRAHMHSECTSDTRPLLMKCEKLMPWLGFSKFRPTENETRRKPVLRMRNSLSAIDERMTFFFASVVGQRLSSQRRDYNTGLGACVLPGIAKPRAGVRELQSLSY